MGDQVSVHCVPIGLLRTVGTVGDWAGDDMETLGQERQVNRCLSVNQIRPKDPGLRRILGLRHYNGGGSFDASEVKCISVVAVGELRPAAGNVSSFRREISVGALGAIIGVPCDSAARELGQD